MQQAEYLAAKATLQQAARDYYTTGASALSDAEFDALRAQAAAYEDEHGLEGGSVREIAAGAMTPGALRHAVPMLSLDNLYTPADLQAWVASLNGAAVAVEPKLDGLALAVRYQHGRPVRLITRGDGFAGEDVSAVLPRIVGLPRGTFDGEVRGEILFSKTQFAEANEARVAQGSPAFANARNAAVGVVARAVRSGVQSVPRGVQLTFVAYERVGGPRVSHTQAMRALAQQGFVTAANLLAQADRDAAADLLAGHDVTKPVLAFDIDGLVFKVDSPDVREALGANSRAPRWARAYKFAPDEAHTRLLDVQWQVGRTGAVTPRAVLDPVEVGGTTITYATLNNPADIARKGVHIGDLVVVRRAAEVIPEILGVAPGSVPSGDIVIPTHCPNCGEPLNTDQARLRCPSAGECALGRKLTYAVGRDALDIAGMSNSIVDQLVASGHVADVADLFELDADTLAAVETGRVAKDGSPVLVGPVVGAKLAAEIERARTKATFERVLIALGLVGTGRALSRKLAVHFQNMDALCAASPADVAVVTGAAKAAGVVAQLRTLAPVVERLREAGLAMQIRTEQGRHDLPLAGQTVVVTGSLPSLGSRSQAVAKLEAWGAVVASSVSKNTTLVIGDNPESTSSKMVKARALGIAVVDEAELLALIGGHA